MDFDKLNEFGINIIFGRKKAIDRMIEINVNYEPMKNLILNNSPLFYAIRTGKIGITKMLLEAGYKIDP